MSDKRKTPRFFSCLQVKEIEKRDSVLTNVQQIARNLFSDHVFAFEFTSVLLIVAVAGTVLLTRKEKRRGSES